MFIVCYLFVYLLVYVYVIVGVRWWLFVGSCLLFASCWLLVVVRVLFEVVVCLLFVRLIVV